MTSDWIKDITAEELQEPYQEMAAIIGVEATIKLALHYGGLPFYFLKVDDLLQRRRDETIRAEFNGANYRDLARKYNLSEMHIRRILRGVKDDRQVALFENGNE